MLLNSRYNKHRNKLSSNSLNSLCSNKWPLPKTLCLKALLPLSNRLNRYSNLLYSHRYSSHSNHSNLLLLSHLLLWLTLRAICTHASMAKCKSRIMRLLRSSNLQWPSLLCTSKWLKCKLIRTWYRIPLIALKA